MSGSGKIDNDGFQNIRSVLLSMEKGIFLLDIESIIKK